MTPRQRPSLSASLPERRLRGRLVEAEDLAEFPGGPGSVRLEDRLDAHLTRRRQLAEHALEHALEPEEGLRAPQHPRPLVRRPADDQRREPADPRPRLGL